MAGYNRPATPRGIERQLRQASGFGCARCGHPYIEYHHIVPWAEEQHFRADDMIALCGNCHPAVSGWGRDRQYALKAAPHNIERGFAAGALDYDKRDLTFKVGGNWYENTPVILQLHDTPLISCRIVDDQAKVSLILLDETLHQLLVVEDNDVTFRVDDLWDFEYGHRYAVARYGPRRIALRMDFRGDEAIIEGNMWLGNQQVKLDPDKTTLPGDNQMIGCRVSNCQTALQIGDPVLALPMRCRLL